MDDLRRLRAFHAVAEHRSFSAGALELGYAQSVVSHHVAALERQFGLSLINRGTRPVILLLRGRGVIGNERGTALCRPARSGPARVPFDLIADFDHRNPLRRVPRSCSLSVALVDRGVLLRFVA